MRPRRLDAVDAAVRESTRPVRERATVSVPHRKKWVQKRVRDRAKADRHYREYYLTELQGSKCFATWLAVREATTAY